MTALVGLPKKVKCLVSIHSNPSVELCFSNEVVYAFQMNRHGAMSVSFVLKIRIRKPVRAQVSCHRDIRNLQQHRSSHNIFSFHKSFSRFQPYGQSRQCQYLHLLTLKCQYREEPAPTLKDHKHKLH